MRWFFLIAAGLLCVLLIASQVVLPGVFEELLLSQLISSIEEVGSVDLQVASYPALKMFFGRLDYLKADGTNVVVNGIPISQIFFEVQGLTLDPGELMMRRTLQVRSVKEGHMTILLTEEGANNYFRRMNPSFDRFKVELADSGPRVMGDVEILGVRLAIRIDGKFTVENEGRISFVAEKFIVENTQVPPILLRQLVNEWDLSIDLAGTPLPLKVKSVKVEEGTILIISELG